MGNIEGFNGKGRPKGKGMNCVNNEVTGDRGEWQKKTYGGE